jgi:hypothetical protein
MLPDQKKVHFTTFISNSLIPAPIFYILSHHISLATSHSRIPKIAGSNPAETVTFFGQKNPQQAFLQKGSKVIRPTSQICGK